MSLDACLALLVYAFVTSITPRWGSLPTILARPEQQVRFHRPLDRVLVDGTRFA